MRRRVELHDGTVSAESQGLGQGSVFTVWLPLDAAVSVPAPADAANTRVLIIEDNADMRDSMKGLLEAYGYGVEVASTGESGVQRLLELRPHAAIVDIGLPGIDGFEVARRVRSAGALPAVRLIALSGYSGPDVEEKARKAGFDVHLVKPVNVGDIARVIGSSVDM